QSEDHSCCCGHKKSAEPRSCCAKTRKSCCAKPEREAAASLAIASAPAKCCCALKGRLPALPDEASRLALRFKQMLPESVTGQGPVFKQDCLSLSLGHDETCHPAGVSVHERLCRWII